MASISVIAIGLIKVLVRGKINYAAFGGGESSSPWKAV